MTYSDREAAAIASVSTAIVVKTEPHVLRSENNVVFEVSGDVVVKAVEADRDEALRKELAVLNALAGYPEVVRLASPEAVSANGWTAILLERLDVAGEPTTTEAHKSLSRLHHAMTSLSMPLVNWTDQMHHTVQTWEASPFENDSLNWPHLSR